MGSTLANVGEHILLLDKSQVEVVWAPTVLCVVPACSVRDPSL